MKILSLLIQTIIMLNEANITYKNTTPISSFNFNYKQQYQKPQSFSYTGRNLAILSSSLPSQNLYCTVPTH
jgi:hypothetical protein